MTQDFKSSSSWIHFMTCDPKKEDPGQKSGNRTDTHLELDLPNYQIPSIMNFDGDKMELNRPRRLMESRWFKSNMSYPRTLKYFKSHINIFIMASYDCGVLQFLQQNESNLCAWEARTKWNSWYLKTFMNHDDHWHESALRHN